MKSTILGGHQKSYVTFNRINYRDGSRISSMLAADRACLDFCDQFWTLSQAGRTERGGTVRWTRSHVTGGRAAGGARPRPVLESTELPHPWLSTRTLLSLGGHVQMSGDTFGCHSWVGAAGIACAEARDGVGIPQCTARLPPQNRHSQNVLGLGSRHFSA